MEGISEVDSYSALFIINWPWEGTCLVIVKVARKMMKEKTPFVGRICVLSDRNKRFLTRSLLLF